MCDVSVYHIQLKHSKENNWIKEKATIACAMIFWDSLPDKGLLSTIK